MIIAIINWEGIPRAQADEAYDTLKEKLSRFGMPLEVSIWYISSLDKQTGCA
jgi:hypothetical protein